MFSLSHTLQELCSHSLVNLTMPCIRAPLKMSLPEAGGVK
jgi:hypothetical protein